MKKIISQINNFIKVRNNPVYLNQHLFINKENGQKIIFQEMIHIANKEFYEEVNNDIHYWLNNYETLILLEGVKPLEDENKEKTIKNFNNILYKLIGDSNKIIPHNENNPIAITTILYKEVAKSLNIDYQNDNNYLYNIDNKYKVIADITLNELIQKLQNKDIYINEKDIEDNEYYDKKENIKKLNNIMSKKIFSDIVKRLILLTVRNSNNALSKIEAKINKIKNQEKKKKLMLNKTFLETILIDRNDYLLQTILNNKKTSVLYITYGKAHFDGVKQLLVNKNYHYEGVQKQIQLNI